MNPIASVRRFCMEIWWSLAKPSNSLRIPTLGRGYEDLDNIYLHACFSILVRYVEEDQAMLANLDGSVSSKGQAIAKALEIMEEDAPEGKELARLYKWWKLREGRKANPPRDIFKNFGNANEPIYENYSMGKISGVKVDLNFTPEQELGSLIRHSREHMEFEEDESNLQSLTKLRSKMWI